MKDTRYGVTSLADLGITATMNDLDIALRQEFEKLFGATAAYTVGKQEKISA